jgi:hypothetical protein
MIEPLLKKQYGKQKKPEKGGQEEELGLDAHQSSKINHNE